MEADNHFVNRSYNDTKITQDSWLMIENSLLDMVCPCRQYPHLLVQESHHGTKTYLEDFGIECNKITDLVTQFDFTLQIDSIDLRG